MSRQQPYQPMGQKPLPGVEAQSRMQEILQKRVQVTVNGGSGVSVSGEAAADIGGEPNGAKPSPTPTAISWEEPRKEPGNVYVMMSACKRYSIHASKSDGKWTYECLRRTPYWNNVIGFGGSKEHAIEICQQHARQFP